ncbi:MAG TPA: hypothetical protein VFK13_04360 [Gemmatimonadaceae bacterium]|nr:hypothetical protein [Gemmatimonadaceae bacterium]
MSPDARAPRDARHAADAPGAGQARAAGVVGGAPPAGTEGGEAALLWLEMLARLAALGGHAVRNPLNAAAVNLEVVRTRLARGGGRERGTGGGGALLPFAGRAAEELERATALLNALLDLARPPQPPLDLERVARPLVTVYAAMAASGASDATEGAGTVTLVSGSTPLLIDVPSTVARLAVAGGLDAVCVVGARVECVLEADDGTEASGGGDVRGPLARATIRRVAPDDAVPAQGGVALAKEIVTAARGAGIEIRDVPGGCVMDFPRVRSRVRGG